MNLRHNRFYLVLAAITILSFAETNIFAQTNIRITHSTEQEAGSTNYLGRDYWFAIPQNFTTEDQSQKYYNVYVNSPRNATVNFQVLPDGPIIKKPVTAGKATIFTSPNPAFPAGEVKLSTELHSSGVVEQKTIHVWSDNADIAVYFMSRKPFTTEGMYIVPTIGWGKEYVVAAYSSLNVSSVDLPSEFVVVASQNNTAVTIIPSYDLRADGNATVVAHPAGIPFNVNLQKGECVQYQIVGNPGNQDFDATGTIIRATNPVGVIGASACPFIEVGDPYCDFIMDMMQPSRSWSNVYFSAPFAGRKYGGDTFLLVATQNQTIYQNGSQVAILNKYQAQFVNDITQPSMWTSTAPFMLVQYIPSADHAAPDDAHRNLGDPAEIVINPAAQFNHKVYFQTPTILKAAGQAEFTNYVNVLIRKQQYKSGLTTYDGLPINGPIPFTIKDTFPIPGTGWLAVRIKYQQGQGEGAHSLITTNNPTDTGVGVYIYGYGIDESYGWAGALGSKTITPDTIPPTVTPSGPCWCAHVAIADTGANQSLLSSFVVDSADNMTFLPDTTFNPGSATPVSYYDMCVIDPSKDAYIVVSIYDMAGNRTTVTSISHPLKLTFAPSPINFGTVPVGNTGIVYDTICNNSNFPYHFLKANLYLNDGGKKRVSDAVGFKIDSATDGDIPAKGCKVIKLSFTSNQAPTVKDTLFVFDECQIDSVIVLGNGGAPDFSVPDYTFDCTAINANRPMDSIIVNNSGLPVTIDKVWIEPDATNFSISDPGNATPFTIPGTTTSAVGTHHFIVRFNPSSVGPFTTNLHVQALLPDGVTHIERIATIKGDGCSPLELRDSNTVVTQCEDPITAKFAITNKGNLKDSLISIRGTSNDPAFGPVKLYDSTGNNLITLPTSLPPGVTVYAEVFYTPAPKTSGCFVDSVIVTRLGGSEIYSPSRGYFTVCVKYMDLVPGPDLNFGTLPLGSAKVQNSFQLCNNGTDPLTITNIDSVIPHDASLKLTGMFKQGGATKAFTFPSPGITLAANECVDIFVEFDPAYNNAATNQQQFKIYSNSCTHADTIMTLGAKGLGGPSAQGFTDPPIFSCSVKVDSVHFTNPNLFDGEITAINMTGTDPTNFKYNGPLPILVPKGTAATPYTIGIPITFTPNPQTPAKTYTATVNLTFDNKKGIITTYTAPVSATGQGFDLTVNSQVTDVVQNVKVVAGTYVDMPIKLVLDKHNLTTPLDVVTINRIQLTYNYNMHLLHIDPTKLAASVKTTGGWTLDASNPSTVTESSNTLQLNLIKTGGVLNDADLSNSIATVTFLAVIPDSGSSTAVKLSALKFIDSLGNPSPNCMTIQPKDSVYNLVYSCGDKTLQDFMTKGIFPVIAHPVTPNPAGSASGNLLHFTYSTAKMGHVTLVIYDELGKEVSKVIDDQQLPSGTFEVRYNTSGLSAGNYIYRYTLDGKNAVSGRFVIEK